MFAERDRDTLKLFICYSHQDQDELERFLQFLQPLRDDGLIEPWDNRLIDIGADWKAAIERALEECDAEQSQG